ncbi:hypothetical protein NP493_251g01001 [Ridgeia piscesae]|uniref:Serine/threonine-protein phosphatase n=1 Tax=Ridgeia piscesae TaxID=27915 RepID=A0AAD9NYE9_RIDPI|nr:hypothetical protein NP493_251g01001 [Ridgeia piscesae]
MRTTNPNDLKIDPRYRGLHIKMPMTPAQLQSLIHAFEHKKELHAKYVLIILHQVRNHLKNMPNINYVSTLTSKRITIIGDLHGKLDDLFIILFKNGLPSENNPYVFNGDFVDRGEQSLEVVITLFATFLLNPTAIYFNRGNHEDYVMNLRYGFAKEIMGKYQNDASKIVRLFQDVFSWLPLLTIIDKKILITHGGISDQTDLEYIEQIPRHKYLSVLRPPIEEDVDGIETIDAEAWRQLLDILWSDPKSQAGCSPNTFRGGGVNWGPDITDLFMTKYNLNLIIRSHECKPNGYEYTHGNKVLTLFSASNYYEIGSNKGAFAQLLPMPKELKPNIIQYIFTEQAATMKLTIKQRTNTIEESAMTELRNKMLANKSDLIKEFQKNDKNKSGFLKPITWCKVMGDILVMDIPWRALADKLARVNPNGMIDYMSMFEKNQIVFGNLDDHAVRGGSSFTELLYRNKGNLEMIFRAIDKDNSGHISEEEFSEACSVLCQHTGTVLTKDQIKNMASAMDQNKDGQIDFNEFLEAFRIVDQQHTMEVRRGQAKS